MSLKASKRLVIDADVAHAAGGKDAVYPIRWLEEGAELKEKWKLAWRDVK